MCLWTLHIKTPYAYCFSWNFILQVSALETENIEHVYQATTKRLEKLVIMQFYRNWVQEKNGLTYGFCHLPCMILNLKALVSSL